MMAPPSQGLEPPANPARFSGDKASSIGAYVLSSSDLVQVLQEKLQGAEKMAAIISDLSRELTAMDRYERQTLSRRKTAIRKIDEAKLRIELEDRRRRII
jgi:hypothetical protein